MMLAAILAMVNLQGTLGTAMIGMPWLHEHFLCRVYDWITMMSSRRKESPSPESYMYPGMIDKPRCSCRLCISVMRLAAIVSLTLAPAWVACAQSYPVRPIRYVVPFPAGGGVDIVARLVGQKIAESLGQQVVIDNRGGAGGIIGAEIVARAAPNGYTIVMGLIRSCSKSCLTMQ